MKLTKSKLKQIIKEELEAMREEKIELIPGDLKSLLPSQAFDLLQTIAPFLPPVAGTIARASDAPPSVRLPPPAGMLASAMSISDLTDLLDAIAVASREKKRAKDARQ
jgi:hypothetical protein